MLNYNSHEMKYIFTYELVAWRTFILRFISTCSTYYNPGKSSSLVLRKLTIYLYSFIYLLFGCTLQHAGS